jgi:superfamily II DNA or RNA helicase
MRIVRFEHVDQLIHATPGSDDVAAQDIYRLLSPALKYNRKVTLKGAGGRQKFEWRENMLIEMAHGVNYFPVGLLSRAREVCAGAEVGVDYAVISKPTIPTPDLKRITPCTDPARVDDQRLVLANIFTQDCGVIKAPTGFGKTFCIEEIVAAYPKLWIVICTRRSDVMRSIYERVSKKVSLSEIGAVGGKYNNPNRITVCTAKSLKKTPYGKCELLLYDEVHEAAAPETSKMIAAFTKARRFGFSASPKGRSDGSDRLTEAMFGPVICEVSYQDAQAKGAVAKIDVHAYPVHGSPVDMEQHVARMRHGIWRNDIRNRIVVATASQHALQGKQTLIIVDKVEHALRLRKYLPQWPVVYGSITDEKRKMFVRWGLMQTNEQPITLEQRDHYRRQFEAGNLRFAIATGVWNTGVDFKHLDVLARADGGAGEILNTQTPGRLSRGKHGLLLDYKDGFDEKFHDRWKRRMSTYRGKGWIIQDMPLPTQILQSV